MTKDEIFDIVRTMISYIKHVEKHTVVPGNMLIDDLQLSTTDYVDLISRVEKSFNISLTVYSVRNLVDFIAMRLDLEGRK